METSVPDASPSNFLAWFPPVTVNQGHDKPPVPALDAVATLIADFTQMVQGVHEHGCGFEAQNEAWYRFLAQPDPFDQIVVSGSRATLVGIDTVVLRQRRDFLRPDSLLAVIVVTDENEEAADPLSIGGQGWAFENGTFPGSPNGAAPQGTIECQNQDPTNPLMTGPNDPNCTSCAFIQNDPNFSNRCPKDGMGGTMGYLDPTNDNLNVRFYNQKQRFGLVAGYPTSRYLRALQQPVVPDSAHEHDKSGNYIGDQQANANCVNPIFAENLPTDPSGELCHLVRGPRTNDLVYYAAIAGIPHQLLQAKPGIDKDANGNPICASGTAAADCPQKDTLQPGDWVSITGNDPDHYDFSGVDFHMLESEDTRPGATCLPTSPDNCDPINGREWTTNKGDLQFSCIFQLTDGKMPVKKDCTLPQYQGACDCASGALNSQTQLCEKDATGKYTTNQINGKAYPSVREASIVHHMGTQGIISSLCPIHVIEKAPGDPLYGYRPATKAVVDRLKNALANQCLPQRLVPDPNNGNEVPCLILVSLNGTTSDGACKNPGGACIGTDKGLSPPDPDLASKFCDSQEKAWMDNGGAASGAPDPLTIPLCQLAQLTPQNNPGDFDSNGACTVMNGDPGWCYVSGKAARGCPQAILFTDNEPPHDSIVTLYCGG